MSIAVKRNSRFHLRIALSWFKNGDKRTDHHTCNKIYILGFKVDDNNDSALQQIRSRNYQQKYLSEDKNIYLIGIDFNSDKNNISSFEWEQVKTA